MAYEIQTQNAILQRMLDASPPDVDKRQGSITYDLLSPASIEVAQAYLSLNDVLTYGFAGPNQPGNYLDLRCAEIGVTRKASVQATGQVTFTGTDGTLIPVGTQVLTTDNTPIVFTTNADVTIASGTATVNVTAVLGGVNGNVAAGKITLTSGNITGIASVTNIQAFSGGVNTETDDALLGRYFDKVRQPATSGNANHYVQWAKDVAGVYNAKVYEVWNGNGTVKVVLLGTDGHAPAQSIVDAATTYIAQERPIGATVTVVGATEVAINVSATLTLETGATIASVTAQFQSALADYLKSLAFVDPLVRYTRIANLLLDVPNIVDYSNLTVNGGTANIQIADGSVAVPGTVTFS